MASSLEFVEYVCEQIGGGGTITYRKMFGEYGIYCNSKIIGVIGDNQLYVKKTGFGKKMLGENAEEASPYEGAKPHYVINSLEDREFLAEFIAGTCEELPMPKPKKK